MFNIYNITSYRSAEMYDPKSDSWNEICDMHSARDGACNASDGEAIYVLGGYDGSDYSLTTEVYRPETGEWDNTCKLLMFAAIIIIRNHVAEY